MDDEEVEIPSLLFAFAKTEFVVGYWLPTSYCEEVFVQHLSVRKWLDGRVWFILHTRRPIPSFVATDPQLFHILFLRTAYVRAGNNVIRAL